MSESSSRNVGGDVMELNSDAKLKLPECWWRCSVAFVIGTRSARKQTAWRRYCRDVDVGLGCRVFVDRSAGGDQIRELLIDDCANILEDRLADSHSGVTT